MGVIVAILYVIGLIAGFGLVLKSGSVRETILGCNLVFLAFIGGYNLFS